jgi:fibronectin-binding autotransporter adhesin
MNPKQILSIGAFFTLALTTALAQTTSWKGTSSTSWSTSANWTAGVPSSSVDAIIGDANFTGANQPSLTASGTSGACRSLLLGDGLKASALTVSRSLTVFGDITLGANGTISHTSSSSSRVINLRGNWTNSGVYAGSGTSSTVTFGGTSQFIGGSTPTAFRRLTINAGSVTTLGSHISVTYTLSISGTLDPGIGSGAIVSGAGALSVASGGKILVRAATLAGNFAMSGTKTLSVGSTVDYAASGDQSVTSSLTYSTLRISGGGIKTLSGNLPSLASSLATAGNIDIAAGTLDLSTFTANRGTTMAGGSVTVAAGATLKIGGTGTFPANYATHAFVLTSTVMYAGANQTVTAESYGSLILSGSSGVVTKTMPALALTVAGSLTADQGTATAVVFSAGGALTVNGSVALGAATTFSGGSFSHSIGGNWTNNGTFTSGSSTLTMNGVNTVISGAGTNNFFNLVLARSGIRADTNTSLNVAGDFSTTGAGTFTHTVGGTGTVTMNGAGKTISGAGISFSKLTIAGSISTSASISIADDLAVSGSLTASGGAISLTGTGKRILGPGPIAFNTVSVPGGITTTNSFSVAGDFGVSGSFTATAGTVTAVGSGIFSGTVSMFNVTLNGTAVHMAADSVIRIAGTSTVIAGTFDVTNSRPNTIVYNGAGSQLVYPITYDNLEIAAGGIKSAVGNINVRGNLTIGAGAVFAGGTGGFTNYLRHNWFNYGTFSAGNSAVELVGPNNTTIFGANTFNRLRVNKEVSTLLVNLEANQTVATLDMVNGTMNTGTNTLTLTTTRTGSGNVLGTIQRQHSFSPGTSYAFESPFTTITFSALTSVSSVTVAVAPGLVGDFPSGGAINRLYTLSLSSSGAYNAAFRARYDDAALNGNDETVMALWRNTGSGWALSGKSGNDAANNWVEQSSLPNLTGRWTMSDDSSMVRWNGAVSTAWETAANWTVVSGGPSLPPFTNDIVELGTTNVTYQPTITSAAKAKGLSFGSVQAMTLTLGSGGSLETIGNVAGIWTNNITHTLNVGAQSLRVGNNLTLSDGVSGHAINLTASSGLVTISDALIESGGANVTFTGAGTLAVGGNFDYVSGTFTPATSTTYYTGSGDQNVGGVTYNHLIFNKPSGTASLPVAAGVNGNLTLTNGGTFRLNAPLSVAGTVMIRTNTTLHLGGAALHVGGDWLRDGTLNISSGGEVLFNGTGTQYVGATDFHDIDINKASGAAILTGNISAAVDADVLGGTLDLSTFAINAGNAGALLSMAAGTTLRTAGSFPGGFATVSIDPASTVEYYGTGNQAVLPVTYGHLMVTNGGSNPKTLAGHVTVAGNLLIATNATLAASTNSLMLLGNWTKQGVFAGGTGTVILGGTNKTVAGDTTFNNLTVTGSYNVANNHNLTMNGNTTVLGTFGGGNGVFTIDGDFFNAGTLTSGGTIIFTGTRLQSLQSITPIQSGPAGVVNFNGTVSPVLFSTIPPQFATVNINNTGGIIAGSGWTVYGRFQVGPGASFDGSVFTHTFAGAVTNHGTMTSSGTLDFSPANATTLTLGATFSSSGIVAFHGAKQITISSSALSLNSVIIANTHAAGITPVANWTLTGDFQVGSAAVFHAGTGLTHTISGNVENNGIIDGGSSLVVFNGTTEMTGSGSSVWHHLRNSGSLAVLADIALTGNFTNNSVFDASGADVAFTGDSPSIIAGSATPTPIDSLVIAKTSATVTLALNLTNLTALNIVSGTLDTAAFSVTEDAVDTGALTVQAGATLKLGGNNAFPTFSNGVSLDPASTVEYSGASAQTIAAKDYGNLTSSATGSRTLASSGTIGIAGAFTSGANSYTVTGSTLSFNGAGAQTIPAFSYNHLSSSSGGARSLAASGSINIAGTFTPGGNSYTVSSSTLNFNGAAQTIPAFTYGSLTTSGSGAKTLGGNISVAGTLSLTAGSFADGGFTVTNQGDIANAVTHSGTGKILLSGGGAEHQLSGAGVYQNLALDDSFGAAAAVTNLTVNGTLTLTSGKITTTTNRVIMGTAGTVSRTDGYVAGFLQKTVAAGSPTLTFEVGGTNVYAPALLAFTNATTGGTLLVKSFDGDHPAIASSGFITNRTLNRYWTLTNSGVVFSNYQATFRFATNDLDAGIVGSNLIGRRFSLGVWTNLTAGSRTATSIQTVNNTDFTDMAFGDGSGASRLGIQTQPAATATTGINFPTQPVIRIENNLGALVTADNDTVVTVARGSGSGTLQGTLTATAVNGLITFTNLSHPTAGTITLNFAAAGLAETNSGTITVSPVVLPVKPALGSAATFAVLAGSTVTSGGATTINGDLGVSPGTAVTGAPTVNGTLHQGDATAAQAQLDLTSAYNDVAGRSGGAAASGDLGGQTLLPGIYTSATSLGIATGDLTLDAQGNPDALFIFQMGTTFITAINSQVILTNGAQACNVYWQVGSSVTLGGNSVLKGNLLVYTTIGVADGATLEGRALARNGAVNLVANTITVPPCPNSQTITFPSPGNQTYGVAPIALTATASSGLAVSYSVTSGPATVSSNILTITGAGSVTIQAIQTGAVNWIAAPPGDQTILVAQKALTVTANDTNRLYGAADPAFTITYSGFVNGDIAGVISGAPAFNTSANGSSAVGSYAITPSLGTLSATNYVFPTFNNGTLTLAKASTTVAASSSANPAPTGSNVTFTATLTVVAPGGGTPTDTVQFLSDGAALGSSAPLVNGMASFVTASLSHGSHTITAEYPGDGNFLGHTNDLTQVINTPPAVGNDTLQRYPTSGAKGRVATLLANDTDTDGDTLALSSVSPASAQGGTVRVANSWVFYTRPAGFTNADSLAYVATDGGLQTTGSVAITIVADADSSPNVVTTEALGNGDFRPHFLGIPGRTYTIQSTTNLGTPDWQTLGTAAAAATGTFEFTDSPPPASPTRFYRSTYP